MPIPEGHKQRFDFWAVVGRAPSNITKYVYEPDEVNLAEGWWTIQVGRGGGVSWPLLRMHARIGGLQRAGNAGRRAGRTPQPLARLPACLPRGAARPSPPSQVDGGLLSEFPSLLATDVVSKFGKADEELDPMGDWFEMPSALQGLKKYAGGKTNMTQLVRRGLGVGGGGLACGLSARSRA